MEIDGKRVEDPPFQNLPACTEGRYARWHFDSDWTEHWEFYEDGMCFEDWGKMNLSWLFKVDPSGELWEELYEGFRAEDWRYGSCGGCI